MSETYTSREVAAIFRCSPSKITATATTFGIGANLGGRAGFRFRDSDIEALWAALRPNPTLPLLRRRRCR
jgi:hypothetical protein